MRKLTIIFALGLMVFSCKDKGSQGSANTEKVEIAFMKQGELSFLNEGELLKKIEIEIADTKNKQARGLMDRSGMEENRGMLFIFDDNDIRRHTFYMKNTRFPLDIMYFDKDSVLINIARNAQPGADSKANGGTVDGAASESKFVVEINGGLADKWGVEEGVTKIYWTRD
ncbi:MAG: DUF192 domain-containing protein [Weeksellaceae bacterium]